MKLKALASHPRSGIALSIEDERGVQSLTVSRRDALNDARGIRDGMRAKFPARTRSEFHVHKNRDGSFDYAVGAAPFIWPEDQED